MKRDFKADCSTAPSTPVASSNINERRKGTFGVTVFGKRACPCQSFGVTLFGSSACPCQSFLESPSLAQQTLFVSIFWSHPLWHSRLFVSIFWSHPLWHSTLCSCQSFGVTLFCTAHFVRVSLLESPTLAAGLVRVSLFESPSLKAEFVRVSLLESASLAAEFVRVSHWGRLCLQTGIGKQMIIELRSCVKVEVAVLSSRP